MPSSRRSMLLLVASILIFVSSGAAFGGDALPAVGIDAPAFELPGSDGKTHALVEHRGEAVVVLAWFPKAFTGG